MQLKPHVRLHLLLQLDTLAIWGDHKCIMMYFQKYNMIRASNKVNLYPHLLARDVFAYKCSSRRNQTSCDQLVCQAVSGPGCCSSVMVCSDCTGRSAYSAAASVTRVLGTAHLASDCPLRTSYNPVHLNVSIECYYPRADCSEFGRLGSLSKWNVFRITDFSKLWGSIPATLNKPWIPQGLSRA